MKIRLCAPLLTVFLGVSAFAGGATGVGSGGNSIDSNGRPSLRDLVDLTVCQWVAGTDMLNREPHSKKIFASLDRYDHLYGDLLRNEAAGVNFCLTEGDLVQVKTEDLDGLTVFTQDTRQLAIRMNDAVYVDRKIFDAMDERSRAYLVVHELMHSFIPVRLNEQNWQFVNTDQDVQLKSEFGAGKSWPRIKQRNSKLRSFIKFLSDHESQPIQLDSFLLQIRMNNVLWPATRLNLKTLELYRNMIAAPQDSEAQRINTAMTLLTAELPYRTWLAIGDDASLQRFDSALSPNYTQNTPSQRSGGGNFHDDLYLAGCDRSTESGRTRTHVQCFDSTAERSYPQLDAWMNGLYYPRWLGSGWQTSMGFTQTTLLHLVGKIDPQTFEELLRLDWVWSALKASWTTAYHKGDHYMGPAYLEILRNFCDDKEEMAKVRILLNHPSFPFDAFAREGLAPFSGFSDYYGLHNDLKQCPQLKSVVREACQARGVPFPKLK